MRRQFYLFLFLSAFAGGVTAQNTFQREYYPWADSAVVVVPWASENTSDGGHIIAGYRGGSYINPGTSPFLIRLNANGDTLWVKNYSLDSAFNACFYSVDEDANGNFYTCGSIIDSAGGYDFSVLVMKTDSAGNTLWAGSYSLSTDTTYLERGFRITATSGGGCVLAGDVYSGGYDAFLLKLDSTGTVQWSKVFAGGDNDIFYWVKELSGGGYAVCGETKSYDSIATCCLIRTDANGDTLWTRNYHTPVTSIAWVVDVTSDGGFIIPVTTYGSDPGMALMKLDAAGDTSWIKTYGGAGTDYGYYAAELPGGGYVVAGTSYSFNDSVHGNVFLVRTGSSGQVLWAREYGGSNAEEGWVVQRKAGGGFHLLGYTDSSVPTSGCYFVSTDTSGFSGCNEYAVSPVTGTLPVQIGAAPFTISSGVTVSTRSISEKRGGSLIDPCVPTGINTAKVPRLHIYPNPAGNYVRIETGESLQQAEVLVCTLQGREVKRSSNVNGASATLDVSDLARGIYFITIRSNGTSRFAGKLAIER